MSSRQQKKTRDQYKARYFDKFIQLKCAPDLLGHNLFPNAKEVTESMAMFEATMHLDEGYEWNNPDVCCIVVGDGHQPRTGALMACRTAWTVHSVDPQLRPRLYDFKRLHTHRSQIESAKISVDQSRVLVLLPHSHATMPATINAMPEGKELCIISMPCCVPHRVPSMEPFEYEDINVHSPHNKIKIWKKVP